MIILHTKVTMFIPRRTSISGRVRVPLFANEAAVITEANLKCSRVQFISSIYSRLIGSSPLAHVSVRLHSRNRE